MRSLQRLAKRRGGLLRSHWYFGGASKLEWQCRSAHVWKAAPNKVRSGRWCPTCAGRPKRSLEDAQRVARERGGRCLSKEYKNNKTPLLWECVRAHRWEARADRVMRNVTPTWCAICAGAVRRTIEDMRGWARMRGGRVLSNVARGMHTKLQWECVHGHRFWMRPNAVKYGAWCPRCWKARRGQVSREMWQRRRKAR